MRFTTFRLLAGLCTLQIWILNVAARTFPVNIGVFYDRELPGGELEISQITWEKLYKSFGLIEYKNTSTTKVELHIVPISLRGLSLPQIASVFCSQIVNNDVAVVVVHTTDEQFTRYLASLASHFWIPVVGTTTKEPCLSDKNVYRSFLRTIPSNTQQFQVALQLIQYTGNSEAFVVVSDDVSHGHALEFFSKIESLSVTVLKIDSNRISQPEVNKNLLRIKASITRAVFLYCDTELARIILWSAKDFRMFKDDFLWIVSDNVVHDARELFVLPSGIHGIRAKNSANTERFYRARLEESYAIIYRTFQFSSDTARRRFSRKSSACFGSDHWEYGAELYRKLLQTQLSTTDSTVVKLDDKGDRVNFTYETLYLQEAVDYAKRWITTTWWINGKLTLGAGHYISGEKRRGIGLPKLRAAVVEYPPLTMKSAYDPLIGCNQGILCLDYVGGLENYTKHCCYGLAIDVLNHVKVELEFEPIVYFVRDGNYGAKNATSNQWNGIVRDLETGEADLSIDLMANEARSEVVDFSLRWTQAGLALLVLVGEKKVDNIDFSFFYPFTTQLWVGIIAIVNVYLFGLWITDRLSPYGWHRTNQREKSSEGEFDLNSSMWFCWGVCFDYQFVESKPASYSSRAMAVCLATFGLLCLTSYTANLTAHLVSDDTKPDVTGIRDPKITAPDSKLTFGVVKSSYVDSYFELNQDPVMQELFRRMSNRGHLVDNFTDGVDRLKTRKLDIFISEILSLDYEVAKQKAPGYPRLQVVGASSPFADTGYSYSFKKNSTWKPKFDLVVNRLKAENKPSELYKKWVSSGKTTADEPHERLDEHSLSGVFFLGSSLALLCFMFLIIENKLYSMGIIYRNFRKCTEIYDRGKRKFSLEIHRKLLDIRKEKDEAIELPDISNYLENRRRTIVSLHSIYNPKATKSKYGEMMDSATPSNSV